MADFVVRSWNGKLHPAIEYFPNARKRAKGGDPDGGPFGREVLRLTLSATQEALGFGTLCALYREGALVRAIEPKPDAGP